jgi:hypothetical protein
MVFQGATLHSSVRVFYPEDCGNSSPSNIGTFRTSVFMERKDAASDSFSSLGNPVDDSESA